MLLDAARKSDDPRLFKRATDIALQSRSGESALQAARAWREAIPASREANRYLLQILVGLNRDLYPKAVWEAPEGTPEALVSVKQAIRAFPAPKFWERGLAPTDIPHHPNHWCMVPKSKNFVTEGALIQGTARGRSFRTLSWDRPSPTIAYGNREVHIHPDCKRRLSVYEALRLQGFPKRFELLGTLSSQIQQVSEAVPPPLGKAIAKSILDILAAQPVRQKKAA